MNDITDKTTPDATSSSTDNTSPALANDSKNMALLLHILSLFFWFVPALIFYLVKADDSFVRHHARENLNLMITLFLAYIAVTVASVVLAFIPLLGMLLITVMYLTLLVGGLVLIILAAINASKGIQYRMPFVLRLVS